MFAAPLAAAVVLVLQRCKPVPIPLLRDVLEPRWLIRLLFVLAVSAGSVRPQAAQRVRADGGGAKAAALARLHQVRSTG
jgi:hypothetical protein